MDRQEEVRETLASFMNEGLKRLILSNPRSREHFLKLTVRPVLLKGALKFQIEEFTEKQAFQKNLDKEEAVAYLTDQLEQHYRNGEAEDSAGTMNLLVSKKGTVTIKRKKKAERITPTPTALLSHNRKKRYVLEEGIPVPFLIDLGVMTQEGTVVKAKFDKFRQINRFLEFVEDVLPQLDRSRENVIVDFGCGKSYLTFAMYYYLKELKGYPVRIIGLDLKKDVIALCNRLSEKFGFEHLHFYHGDIAGYEGLDRVDMVVTLHACDTATDFALEKAIRWGAKVILSVPCCQHELNGQIDSELLRPVLKYGILKERMAALITDGIRAELLEAAGYRTQILEFIDMEHTPKNLLIRAVKQERVEETERETSRKADRETAREVGKDSEKRVSEEITGGAEQEPLAELMKQLHVSPTLYRLLSE